MLAPNFRQRLEVMDMAVPSSNVPIDCLKVETTDPTDGAKSSYALMS